MSLETFPKSKKYQIILADPPWGYNGKMMNASVTDHYTVMDINSIALLPVKELADKNCVLFMWVTFPKLNEFMRVVTEWGFEYKTCAFVWVKTNKRKAVNQHSFLPEESFDDFMGQGRWTRANAEICILATKGSIPRQSAGVRQIIYAPIERHSKKPDETRQRIIELVGDLPRIELFARQKTPGWAIWGNEVESDIVFEGHHREEL